MALFNQSAKAVSAVVIEIADSAGASGDTEQKTRAWKSLQAAMEFLNTRANWDFALVEAPASAVIGPLTLVGVSASANQTSAGLPAGHGLQVDDYVSGTPFVVGTRVSATAAAAIGLTVPVTAGIGTGVQVFTITGLRDMYDLPSDFKAEYSVRLLGTQRVLRSIRQRQLGRARVSEQDTATPVGYDVFPVGQKGKIRLARIPAATDTMLTRYYRRLDVPSASASTGLLDIPQDYEWVPIAWAKWHYLTDKANAKSDQAQVWIALANDGITKMIADQTRRPDEDLMFIPGAAFGDTTLNAMDAIQWDFT